MAAISRLGKRNINAGLVSQGSRRILKMMYFQAHTRQAYVGCIFIPSDLLFEDLRCSAPYLWVF